MILHFKNNQPIHHLWSFFVKFFFVFFFVSFYCQRSFVVTTCHICITIVVQFANQAPPLEAITQRLSLGRLVGHPDTDAQPRSACELPYSEELLPSGKEGSNQVCIPTPSTTQVQFLMDALSAAAAAAATASAVSSSPHSHAPASSAEASSLQRARLSTLLHYIADLAAAFLRKVRGCEVDMCVYQPCLATPRQVGFMGMVLYVFHMMA